MFVQTKLGDKINSSKPFNQVMPIFPSNLIFVSLNRLKA